MNIYIGTSGYNYRDWKNIFYPEGLGQSKWLAFYSTQFSTVEINATFYRHFERKTFEKWYQNTESGFVFTIKGPKLITHINRLKNIDELLFKFNSSVIGLQEKLKNVLWQFPASFKNSEENAQKVKDFIELVNEKHLYDSILEFRDKSWFTEMFMEVLKEKNVGFVINDTKAFDTAELVGGKIVYIRFHGPDKLYDSLYTTKEMDRWSKKIIEYAKVYDVFCYFNNDMHGYAIENIRILKEYLHL
jgi:uncharacterized protein YecE (DUF72 family)